MKHSADCKAEIGTNIELDPITPYSFGFPDVDFARRETPWDLSCLLYKGGAATEVRLFARNKSEGSLPHIELDRLTLVTEIHQVLIDKLTIGGSKTSAKGAIRFIRDMFTWAEKEGFSLDKSSIQETYFAWSDHLWREAEVYKKISISSAYGRSANVSIILSDVLKRVTPLISETRLRHPSKDKSHANLQAEKQSLQQIFDFGKILLKISDMLTLDVVMEGPSPIEVFLDDEEGSTSLRFFECQGVIHNGIKDKLHRRNLALDDTATFKDWQENAAYKDRAPIINRRIEAELLIFVAQTSMNWSQASKLPICKFRYDSYSDGYQVRDRKERRKGEVIFEIFSAYKPHFERYLAWRRVLFPEHPKLFPFVREDETSESWHFQSRLRPQLLKSGKCFLPPSVLRNNKVNWLLRKTGDPDLTAEMAQHSKQTLLTIYEVPSLQRAMVEIFRYWNTCDPTTHSLASVAPGRCNGHPKKSENIDYDLEPDCRRSSGCIGCEQHRDVDSEDHVWALVSFRHLKIIEISKSLRPGIQTQPTPAQKVVDRLSEKLNWFKKSSIKHEAWLHEALIKIEEGNYHPSWITAIHAIEGEL
ncbi:hypothetical protein G7009_09435 [Pseudomonas capeferrum]|uniref:hypothetical protein n=1 Tax=Pseudomonas capeferrum TaxID=1495066 RepID=UPI0015E47693|nr:hypothetical protein [Pseudomonas capeferrum]MBA1201980.1 hypothetical protein [Pseudomonas capeferrum]